MGRSVVGADIIRPNKDISTTTGGQVSEATCVSSPYKRKGVITMKRILLILTCIAVILNLVGCAEDAVQPGTINTASLTRLFLRD